MKLKDVREMLDHINRKRPDNRFENLREADRHLNTSNTCNTYIVSGVSYDPTGNGRYRSILTVKGKTYRKHFGVREFGDEKAKELAIEYRKQLEEKYLGRVSG